MKQLAPLRLKPKYFEIIRREILEILKEILYRPMLRAIKVNDREILNSKSALYRAVADGRVWYADGRFQGKFGSPISKELRDLGALWNAKSKSWSLPAASVPAQIRMAQAAASLLYDELRKSLLHTLDDIKIDSVAQVNRLKDKYTKSIEWMDDDFQKTVEFISIEAKLNDEQKRLIVDEYSENLEKYIKNWTEEDIFELRQKVQGNSFIGQRAENLVKMIQKDYGVAENKARFLARQETSLMMSKFKESRYRDVGSTRYKWSTSGSPRVRVDHAELNGKIFSWDSPPVTNKSTGAKNHPGEDYGCECVAIPIID